MGQQINTERHDHIHHARGPNRIRHPLEELSRSQREVFTHTESFATALRGALREDPDVIMVGEMRDLDTISLAITAAETGHLVLATLHTSKCIAHTDRLLDVFPTGTTGTRAGYGR